jgi:hypothetical protein
VVRETLYGVRDWEIASQAVLKASAYRHDFSVAAYELTVTEKYIVLVSA